jgi:hypothetical protein
VLLVQQHQGGGGDRADSPGTEANSAQGLEGGLEQGVAAFGERAGGGVQDVDRALIIAEGRSAVLLIGMVTAVCSPS